MTSDADVLTAAGWFPGRDAAAPAMRAILEACAVVEPRAGGAGWEVFPAAREALRAYHGLLVRPSGPGLDVAPTGAVVDPREAQYASGAFEQVRKHTGARLFPFGRTDTDAPIAVDELGRLFVVDHGGARMLGDSVPDGLTALARGRMPVRLTARRRSWTFGPLRSAELLTDAVKVALTGVYVLHRAGAYSAREIRLRATTLRGVGDVALDRGFPLPAGSLEAAAEPLVRGMGGALAEAGARAEGAELRLSVPAPRGTGTLARADFDCVLTVGGSAARPTTAELVLSAGPGACIGHPAEVFEALTADFERCAAA
ncbi:SUKH-3 domain-containing protein [Streptomyces sp. NPDC054932]